MLETVSSSLTSIADYRLIDFGRGRKLEFFAGKLLDRPCPAADGINMQCKGEWQHASLRFLDKRWVNTDRKAKSSTLPLYNDDWVFRWREMSLGLKTCPFGHIGFFPEQIENWDWLMQLGPNQGEQDLPLITKPNSLNLFAYTGGSSIALALAGFAVTHLDSSKPAVTWAKRNADRSGLQDHPIRWIVDDARDFVAREVRRERRYDLVVLDPPAFGHGVDARRWELKADLGPLLETCLDLLSDEPIGILLTGHSPIESLELGPMDRTISKRLSSKFKHFDAKRSHLTDATGRFLDCGYNLRWFNSRS